VTTRYVIGADGGNSKTDLVLADDTGTVLARVTGAGTRPQLDGLDNTVDGLLALIGRAKDQAGLPAATAVAVASFLLANVDFPDEEAAMYAALTARGVADLVEVDNDTLAVLRAGAENGWGIAVVSGAGINAIGRHPDGRTERFLGIGSISGDWGGGWGIAVAGIAAAVRAGDGRGRPTILRERTVATFGRDAEAVAVAVDRGEITEREVFAFAPVVFTAAEDGDAVAAALVRRLGTEVLDYVRALTARMHLADAQFEVVLGGSALQAGNRVLLDHIAAGVAAGAPRARLRVLDVPPVAGALVAALELAGAGRDAVGRARTALRGAISTSPVP
jgi:N-acetylglucosamine kinase-like BadF-type ATPase